MKRQLSTSFTLGTILGLCLWWAQVSFASLDSSMPGLEAKFVVTGESQGIVQGYFVVNGQNGWQAAFPTNPNPLMKVK